MSSLPKLVLASGNRHKIMELKELLQGIPFDLVGLDVFQNVIPAEENGKTFVENAIIKARAVMEQTGYWAFADDSGLVIDALGGNPGIYSARYADTDSACIDRVLLEMEQVPDDQRTARFVCCIAIVSPAGECWVDEGKAEGFILRERHGLAGFGYDPIFYYPELKQTFAELSPDIKNSVSHRARAVESAKQRLFDLGHKSI